MMRQLVFLGLVSVATAGFSCEDKSKDCPAWKRNMKGDCTGVDFQYMIANCPVTCELCTEAEAKWATEDAERRKSPTYEPEDSKVVVLDAESIDDFLETAGEEKLLLLEFYAPWCGHCKHVAPSFREAAQRLHDLSKAGKIQTPVVLAKFDDSAEANQHYRAGMETKFNFTSYPTMYVVGGPKEFSQIEYDMSDEKYASKPHLAGLTKKDRYWASKEEAEEIVHHMTELSNGRNQTEALISWNEVEKRTKPGFYKKGGKHETDQIHEVDPSNLQDTVLRDDALWVVEYYSDKCPICNSLAPEMHRAATELQKDFPGKIKFGACNSRVYHELAEAFGITSYPWVTTFYLGKKVEDMAGLGGWKSVYDWGKRKMEEVYKESDVADLTAVIPYKPGDSPEEQEEKKAKALAAKLKQAKGGEL